MELNEERQRLLETAGPLLILGGPGSGKTTIALLKANHEIVSGKLKKHQKVLFLSFARATVARVKEHAITGALLSEGAVRHLEVATYHGFAWTILRSHGYLLNSRRDTRLLAPHDASALLAEIPSEGGAKEAEIRRLFDEEGTLHFDLFAELTAQLLRRSASLARVLSDAYPIIVLDEFQDTNPAEWDMIQALGGSTLIALADPDQRIYEFRGADPRRIGEFVDRFAPTTFDFGGDNHRSGATDIAVFGNDLLNGTNRGRQYQQVDVTRYRTLRGEHLHLDLKIKIFQRLGQLQRTGNAWSLAILVPTNQLMLEVSDFLGRTQTVGEGRRLSPLSHDVAFDPTGPALAAATIAVAMERGETAEVIANRILLSLRDHIRGRSGNRVPAQDQLALAGMLDAYVATGRVRGVARQALIAECVRIGEALSQCVFTGDPAADWTTVRDLFEASTAAPLQRVANDARYVRLLHRGSLLRSRLSEIWRDVGSYVGAEVAVKDALLQEHFSNTVKDWKGVHVMTIHKAKGKEFDEVIVYEGVYKHRIVHPNERDAGKLLERRRNLRVAVTRARLRTTILTPEREPCIFL